jgi:hypothetical protein
MKKKLTKPLRLTPYAWAKLLRLRDLGPTEVGGFGISAADDLLLVEDVQLVEQLCTPMSVKFDDTAVADYFDRQVDDGLPPEQFARLWIHTHPADCAQPSFTDEDTFARCFGSSNWAVMFILARCGATYARLRFRAGPGGQIELPVEIDYSYPFPASEQAAWDAEYQQTVHEEKPRFVRQAAIERDPLDDPWADYDPQLEKLFEGRLLTDEFPVDDLMEALNARYFL